MAEPIEMLIGGGRSTQKGLWNHVLVGDFDICYIISAALKTNGETKTSLVFRPIRW